MRRELNYVSTRSASEASVNSLNSAEQADLSLHERAWGAAAVPIGIVLVASLIARWFADRRRRRLTGERCLITLRLRPCMSPQSRRVWPVRSTPPSSAHSRCGDARPRSGLQRPRPDGLLGKSAAVRDVDLQIYQRMVTAIIGRRAAGRARSSAA